MVWKPKVRQMDQSQHTLNVIDLFAIFTSIYVKLLNVIISLQQIYLMYNSQSTNIPIS